METDYPYPLYNPTNKSSSSSSSSSQTMNSSIISSSRSRKLFNTTSHKDTSNYGKKKGNKGGGVKLSTDPQSVAARERRHRISDRFKILQSLVPGGAKLDTVSMLEHTIEYVKFLKYQLWLHQAIINNNINTCVINNYTCNYDHYCHPNNNYNYSTTCTNFNKYAPQFSHEMMCYDNSNYDVFCCKEEAGGSGSGSGGFRNPEVNVTGVASQATPAVHVQDFSYGYHGNDVDQMMYYKRSYLGI